LLAASLRRRIHGMGADFSTRCHVTTGFLAMDPLSVYWTPHELHTQRWRHLIVVTLAFAVSTRPLERLHKPVETSLSNTSASSCSCMTRLLRRHARAVIWTASLCAHFYKPTGFMQISGARDSTKANETIGKGIHQTGKEPEHTNTDARGHSFP
jgi:hypothetical protein